MPDLFVNRRIKFLQRPSVAVEMCSIIRYLLPVIEDPLMDDVSLRFTPGVAKLIHQANISWGHRPHHRSEPGSFDRHKAMPWQKFPLRLGR